eukprot:m.371073 g.371073  ORF g.371073 m.371073 type:complete len:72 (-) comp57125_c0_seq1:65-280(-)
MRDMAHTKVSSYHPSGSNHGTGTKLTRRYALPPHSLVQLFENNAMTASLYCSSQTALAYNLRTKIHADATG